MQLYEKEATTEIWLLFATHKKLFGICAIHVINTDTKGQISTFLS